MDGRKGWNFDMGKDIDRNITRQLWERLKNTFTKNDVIPVENGGTGVKDLNIAFQKGINDKQITTIDKESITLLNNITMESDFNASFILNKNSILIRDIISLKKEDTTRVTIPAIQFPFESESVIDNILVTNNTRLSIGNGFCTLSFFFRSNTYKQLYNSFFIPLI